MPAQPESRVKKTLLNARVNLIFYFLTLLLSFFSRKIFLDCLGADFIGLTGTLQNLLGFLNLAELGVGSAIGYLLYKPLFDHDEEKITEIISVMGYLYRWIGFIILGAGLILACFLPLIFPNRDEHLTLPLIYCAYFAFLGSSLIGYFINYRQNLLGADQRNYVVTAYFQTSNLVKMLIQMAVAYHTQNLFFWVAIEFIFGIIYSFILNWKINQTYPWLKANVALGMQLFKKYPEVMGKTRQLFIHNISSFTQYQTTSIFIYAFVSLEKVASYGCYTMVFDNIGRLIDQVCGGIIASVGNLVAENNNKLTLEIFWELLSFRTFTTGIVVFGIYNFIESFILLWIGNEYLLSNSFLILLLINYILAIPNSVSNPFLYGFGMFQDIWAPIIKTILYIGFSILGGFLWGLSGILIGNTISLLCIFTLWKPFFLFSRGFKVKVYKFWKIWSKSLCIIIGVNFIFNIIVRHSLTLENITWFSFFIKTISSICLFTIIYFIIMYICFGAFRRLVYRIVSHFKR